MEMGEDILSHALPPTVRPNAPRGHGHGHVHSGVRPTRTCTYDGRACAAEMPKQTPHHLHELNHVRGPAIQ